MRRSDKDVADPQAVLDVLARGEILRLAMISEGGPYVVPLSYAALPGREGFPLEGLVVYVHGAPEGRKIEALRRDPRVCFEVTVDAGVIPAARPCDFSMRYRSVIGEGRATLLLDPSAKVHALSLIALRHGGDASRIDEATAAKVAVFEIAVRSISCKGSPPLTPRRAGATSGR